MENTISKWLILMILMASPVHAASKGVKDIRVYITPLTATATNSEGFVDPEGKRLADSTKDVNQYLKSTVTIVHTEEEADVILTVTNSDFGETGSATTTGPINERKTSQDTIQTVRLMLQAGGYKKLFIGTADPKSFGGWWSQAAGNACKEALRWISANHDQLIAKRQK